MNDKEIKRYAELNAKFHQELTELEAQIESLQEQHNVLSLLLFGSQEEKQALVSGSDSTPVVKKNAPRKVTKAKVDKLVRFLKTNPGASRPAINVEFGDLPNVQVKRLLESGKRAGRIVSEGRGRGTKWYATEEG